MKAIRILGLGSRSTQFYIDYLNQLHNERHGGYSTCPFHMTNIDFNEINPHLPNDFDALVPKMTDIIDNLKLDNEQLLIPNITLHETTDQLTCSEIIHPVQEIIKQLLANHISKIILVGSKYSTKSQSLISQFKQVKIEVLSPTDDEIDFIDEMRVKIYEAGESEIEIDEFNNLLTDCAHRATLVVACTELSIHLRDEFHSYDMARNQIKACYKKAFN